MTDSSEWFVYMLRCSDDSLYTGITTDCERRELEHNADDTKAARYTRARRPVVLVWSTVVRGRSAATREEIRIKGLSRKDKLALLEPCDISRRRS